MSATSEKYSTFMVTGAGVEHIGPKSLCYLLPSFPPPNDFPVMVNKQAKPTSFYGEYKWKIGKEHLNFAYEQSALRQKGSCLLTHANADLLKLCVIWFIWGDRRTISARSIKGYFHVLKSLFLACSALATPITASSLGRYFDSVKDTLLASIPPLSLRILIGLLHDLWTARETLGFEILSPDQIAEIAAFIPNVEINQAQFIPPRIWAYQASRLQLALEDFNAHKEQIFGALQVVTDAYRNNFKSLVNISSSKTRARAPFFKGKPVSGCVYLGSFFEFAEKHQIADLINRWMCSSEKPLASLTTDVASIRLLSRYLSGISLVGTAYLQCFSGMRNGEALSLRSNCLTCEKDDSLGAIYILQGETTKTMYDSDARWLTAPTASIAIEALSIIALWRTQIAIELGCITLAEEDLKNPYLVQLAWEPWAGTTKVVERNGPSWRPVNYTIGFWKGKLPNLFESDALTITAEDEAYVKRFTANADLSKYGEGCVWHLTSHQYRRTVAVMMGASQVSLPAQQYQYKHLTRNQSAYYRKGFQSLRLNRSFTHELISTRYEMVSVELGLLNGPEYVSPIGVKRKTELLNFYEVCSGDELEKAIKKGHIAVKQTIFGVCTSRERCPYGGHDNFAHCPTCNDALLDRRRRGSVDKLGKTIALRLIDVPLNTPLRAQLERSAESILKYKNATS